MRRAWIAVPLAVALALPAPVAFGASFSSGSYKGKTAQRNGKHKRRTISFRADGESGEIFGIKFVETGRCSDGTTTIGKQKDLSATVGADGKFSINATSPGGGTRLSLTGTIAGTKASGRFTVKSRFKKRGTKPNKHGKIKCSTGKVKWSAKLVGA